MSDDSIAGLEPRETQQNDENVIHIDAQSASSLQTNGQQFVVDHCMDPTNGVSLLLSEFRMKVEEAEVLTSTMMMEEKLEAIQFMSTVIERLRCSVKDDGSVIDCDREPNAKIRNDVPFFQHSLETSFKKATKPDLKTVKEDGSVAISSTDIEAINNPNEDHYDTVNYTLFPADIKKEIIEVKSEFPTTMSQGYDNGCNPDDTIGYSRGVKGDLNNLFWHHSPLTKIGYNSIMYNAITTASQRSLNTSAPFVRNCGLTEIERQRRQKQALRMRISRALESNEARQRRLQLNAARNRLRRANETPEFRLRRREIQAQRMRERRAREISDAPEITKLRREIRARRMRERRARLNDEMPELVKLRREREARRMRERRARQLIETPELIQLRRAIQARQMRARRANESTEERELRQQRDAARKRMKRAAPKEPTWFSVENVPPVVKTQDHIISNHTSSSNVFNIGHMNVQFF